MSHANPETDLATKRETALWQQKLKHERAARAGSAESIARVAATPPTLEASGLVKLTARKSAAPRGGPAGAGRRESVVIAGRKVRPGVFSDWLQGWLTSGNHEVEIPLDTPGLRVRSDMAGGGPSEFRGGTPVLGFRSRKNPAGGPLPNVAEHSHVRSLHKWHGGAPDSVQYRRDREASWGQTKSERRVTMEVVREARRQSSLMPQRPMLLPPMEPDNLHSQGSRRDGEFKPENGANERISNHCSLLGTLKRKGAKRASAASFTTTASIVGVNDSSTSCLWGDRLPR